jgi:hypothetical protein
MGYIIAFQERGQNSAGTESVGLEGHENEYGRRERVMGPEKLEVEMSDEVSWKVHLCITNALERYPGI